MNYITKELQQEIQNKFFEKFKLINGKTLNILVANQFFNVYSNYKNVCEKILKEQPLYESIYAILNCILNNLDLVNCCICGKVVSYSKSKSTKFNYISYHCSKECFKKDKAFHKLKYEQRKQKMKEHYGVENVFQLDTVKEKIATTNIKRLGVANPFSSPKIIQKIKQHNIETYGNECVLQSEYGKQKVKETLIAKYGVDNISKDKKNKAISIKNQCQTLRIKSYNEYILKDINYSPMFSLEEYIQTYTPHTVFKWKCHKCHNIFESIYDNGFHKPCPYCKELYRSHYEDEIVNYIKSIYDGNIILNSRDIISPYELDIFIPVKKLAIEFNGVYWHSTTILNNNMQHINKTIQCENKDIALIHIFEDDWNILQTQKKLKSFIHTLIQNNNIYEINSSDDIITLDYSLFSKAITIPNYHYLTSYGPYLINKNGFPIYVNGEILFKRTN